MGAGQYDRVAVSGPYSSSRFRVVLFKRGNKFITYTSDDPSPGQHSTLVMFNTTSNNSISKTYDDPFTSVNTKYPLCTPIECKATNSVSDAAEGSRVKYLYLQFPSIRRNYFGSRSLQNNKAGNQFLTETTENILHLKFQDKQN